MAHGFPAAVVEAAEQSFRKSYTVPESATSKGGSCKEVVNGIRVLPQGKWSWTEVGRVTSLTTKVGGTTRNPNAPYTHYTIGVEIGPEGSGVNTGRKMTRTCYINNERISQGPPPEGQKDGQWSMCMMTTRLLIQFAIALGIPQEELFTVSEDGSRSISAETIDSIFGAESAFLGNYVGFSMSQEIEYEADGKREKNVNTDFNSFFEASL